MAKITVLQDHCYTIIAKMRRNTTLIKVLSYSPIKEQSEGSSFFYPEDFYGLKSDAPHFGHSIAVSGT
jgi:hypothetical protein